MKIIRSPTASFFKKRENFRKKDLHLTLISAKPECRRDSSEFSQFNDNKII